MKLTAEQKRELFAEVSLMTPRQLQKFLEEAPDGVRHLLQWDWEMKARPEQLIPPGKWAYWLILAGRGFGKTRTGAETVREWVKTCRYVNLIGATADDAKDIMIEGESGILEICPPDERPKYKRHERKLVWPNGAVSLIFTADEPERLRGKQHEKLWCDEIAAWRYPEAWDQAKFGLRLGDNPQAVISTTPRPTRMMREIIKDRKTHVTKGSTYDNKANLAEAFFDSIIDKYEGTRLGRQELNAEMLNDMPGALWRSDNIETQRRSEDDVPNGLQRIVVSVDPAVSNDEGSDETGIIVAGVGLDTNGEPRGYVLEDASGRYAPDEWARRAVSMYNKWDADRIVAEANQGGEMVRLTLKSAMSTAPITLVKASRGKVTRAEPVAALYEQGRISHVGLFEELEDQMLSFTSDLDRKAFGRSPDRVDALVWAFTELFPRIIKTNRATRGIKYKPKQRFFA